MSRFEYDPNKRGGGKGVAAILGFAAIYDLCAEETISNAVSRGLNSENPAIKWASRIGGAVIFAHLADRLGDYDPIDHIAEAVGEFQQGVRDLLNETALEVMDE